MSDWGPRVFWKDVTVGETDGGHEVRLDGRTLRTPAKAPLVMPCRALAEAVAEEWAAQDDRVKPATMPVTRLANSAIDKVAPQFAAVADMLAEYGGTDLLCYRAEGPAELVARQGAAWDPILAWAAETLEAPLATGTGILHVTQPEPSLSRLRAHVHAMTPFQLAAFHDLVTISGSLVLAFAVIHDRAPVEELWQFSRIDEDWQAEQWGSDEEAESMAAAKRADFLQAHRAISLIRLP